MQTPGTHQKRQPTPNEAFQNTPRTMPRQSWKHSGQPQQKLKHLTSYRTIGTIGEERPKNAASTISQQRFTRNASTASSDKSRNKAVLFVTNHTEKLMYLMLACHVMAVRKQKKNRPKKPTSCWKGYRHVKGKAWGSKGSCVKCKS